MGTLRDATDTDFRDQELKSTTDYQKEEENATEQREVDGAKTETNPSEALEHRSRGSCHDPGGSWLAKAYCNPPQSSTALVVEPQLWHRLLFSATRRLRSITPVAASSETPPLDRQWLRHQLRQQRPGVRRLWQPRGNSEASPSWMT
ncbi:hypothetical protein NDU88_008147 [Pleurodeles waltl]|uniref:Uncharacterized protein n=1 Tax=Pleurodeles waltl TaxID=8319 RepID=A0AAV7NYB0_PLEWA|nr:hypothetical protein NDU88_008147 [Pleurodeles waltl]